MRMRFFHMCILVITSACLALTGCNTDDDDVSYDLTGSWRVVFFIEDGERITKTESNTWPEVNNGDITAVFTEANEAGNGTISGFTVSNQYLGDYALLGNGQIRIESVTTTFINEPEWTRGYNITAVENYEV
ncbi:MAG: hypothetical protein AAGA86_16115, partial [Bacteroidota bacterium]